MVNIASPPASAAETIRLLLLGDSLTAGLGLTRETSYPARLETALSDRGIDARVINAGVSGDTSAGGLARIDWLLAEKPDAVIIELGANDGLRGFNPKATEENLDAIMGRIKDKGIKVMLCGMLAPPNLGREYGAEFNAIYPRLADKHGSILYPFFLEGVATKQHLNLEDGIHPNAAGVDIIVEGILPYVIKLLEADPRQSGQPLSPAPS
ncbi:MAG: arylesterase [Rhodospirillaceae bacterium]|nr:arylesterase [Rhodospirillaceae bacterium]MBT5014300.1 arylesterase [Rhodospirillaceae bacterium]MBT6407672.1 arylesterase [Rhodospirillaceae bacterium]MBT7357193.1 arylesterase [Rhodospirillaceae bacterium]